MSHDEVWEFFQVFWSESSAREESGCIDPSPLFFNKERFEQISLSVSREVGYIPFIPRTSHVISTLFQRAPPIPPPYAKACIKGETLFVETSVSPAVCVHLNTNTHTNKHGLYLNILPLLRFYTFGSVRGKTCAFSGRCVKTLCFCLWCSCPSIHFL